MRKQLYSLATNAVSSILGTPPYIILFVSDICPNLCNHCWYNPEWKKNNLTGESLSFDELEKISKSIKRIKFLSITGGEAFLRKDLIEIVKVFSKNTKLDRFDIPTSGFDCDLITQKAEEILSSVPNPFRIDISLDGLQDTHNHIRQNANAFQNAVKTIEALKKLKQKHSNFDSAIITTISEDNKNEIGALSKFIEKIFPEGEWMINIARTSNPFNTVSPEVLESYRNANDIISKRIKNNQFIGDRGHKFGKLLTAKNEVRRELIYNILEQKRKGGGCSAGSLIGVVFNNGDVRPCETLTDSFGNIRDYDYNLPLIWNSENAKRIRQKIQETECICTHECFLSTSILLQPSCWAKLIDKRFFGN
jgi:MoaA/NifB/PqqE/SkfB family radical SAM enzyme